MLHGITIISWKLNPSLGPFSPLKSLNPHTQHHSYWHTEQYMWGQPPFFSKDALHLGQWCTFSTFLEAHPSSWDLSFSWQDLLWWLKFLHLTQISFKHFSHFETDYLADLVSITDSQSGEGQKKRFFDLATLWLFMNFWYFENESELIIALTSSSDGVVPQPNWGHFSFVLLFWSSIIDLKVSVKHSLQNMWLH